MKKIEQMKENEAARKKKGKGDVPVVPTSSARPEFSSVSD